MRAGKIAEVSHIEPILACLRLHQDAKSVKDISKFGEELVSIIYSLIDASLEAKLDPRKVKANAFYRAAHSAYWGYELRKARQYAFKGWRTEKYRPRRLLIQILLASLGLHMDRFMNNPYKG